MGAEESNVEIEADVRAWVAEFGSAVAAVDFESARRLFSEDVVAFGTWSELLTGLDELEARQWRQVWPSIDGFGFDVDGTRMLASADGGQAVAMSPWTSIGFGPDGAPFDRPGRATFVLRRSSDGSGAWRCVHSHFSLARDVPQKSHGRPSP